MLGTSEALTKHKSPVNYLQFALLGGVRHIWGFVKARVSCKTSSLYLLGGEEQCSSEALAKQGSAAPHLPFTCLGVLSTYRTFKVS